jgi:hypothetical protein
MEEIISSKDKDETSQLAAIALEAVVKYLREEPEKNFDKSKIKKIYDDKVNDDKVNPEIIDKLRDVEIKVGDSKAEVIKDKDIRDPEVSKVIDNASKEVKSEGKKVTTKNVIEKLLSSVKEIDNLGEEIQAKDYSYSDLDQKQREQLRNDLIKLFGLAKVAASEVIDPNISVINGANAILSYRKEKKIEGELSSEDLEKISSEI